MNHTLNAYGAAEPDSRRLLDEPVRADADGAHRRMGN